MNKYIEYKKRSIFSIITVILLILQLNFLIIYSDGDEIWNYDSGLIDENKTITITFKANDYYLKYIEENFEILMDGFNSILIPGHPKLPVKNYNIGLPPGCKLISFKIIDSSYEKISLSENISNLYFNKYHFENPIYDNQD